MGLVRGQGRGGVGGGEYNSLHHRHVPVMTLCVTYCHCETSLLLMLPESNLYNSMNRAVMETHTQAQMKCLSHWQRRERSSIMATVTKIPGTSHQSTLNWSS